MNFLDKVVISVAAGDGGDGKRSFRHEKFISKGGPDGGDGGHGGDVVLVASRNRNTLASFRYQKELLADAGKPGGKSNMHGRSGQTLVVPVPVGTIATTADGQVIADLTEDEQRATIAKGGHGGFGNAHFVSSRRQTPDFAEKGEPGQVLELTLELKMIADVGLVGLPNAGKSTLLSRVSNARPEIADYPFTTLTPNLGVVDIDAETTVLMADIPGLIAGAAEGKGLGHDFLRHIERTAVIVHLIDAYQADIAETYQTIRAELKAYQPSLLKRPEIVVITKIEGLDDDIIADLKAQLRQVVPKKTPLLAISAAAGSGLSDLLFAVKQTVLAQRDKASAETPTATIPVLTLDDTAAQWRITKEGATYLISGRKIERFALRTDFNNPEGLQRLRDIMKKMGIMHKLIRDGVEAGNMIRIGGAGEFKY